MSVQTRSNWTGIMFGFLIAVLAAFQQFKLPPVLPTMLELFGWNPTIAGSFMSVYALIGLLFSVTISHAINRFGAVRLLVLALLLFVLANPLAMMSPENAWIVLISRAMEGFGFAIMAVLGPVYTNRNASSSHLPIAIALTAVWIPAGQITANIMYPVSEMFLGWQLFWSAGTLFSIAALIWLGAIRKSAAVELSVEEPAGSGQEAEMTRLEKTGIILAALTFTIWSNQFIGYMTWLPQYLTDVRGLGPSAAVFGYSIPISVLLVTSMVMAILMRKGLPIGPVLIVALAIQAAVWFAIPLTTDTLSGLISLVIFGMGMGMTPVCLFGMPSTILGVRRAGPKSFAILMTGRNLGVLTGPVLLPWIITSGGSWTDVGLVFGAVTLIGVGLAIVLLILLGRMKSAQA